MTTKTVKDLKKEIKFVKSQMLKVPGAQQLRNSGVEVVASADFGVDHKLEVYANGFVWYRFEQHQTVFRLHKVENMYYSTPEEEKTPLPWQFHLMMVGDDHIFRNMECAAEKKLLTQEEVNEDNIVYLDKKAIDPLEQMIREENDDFLCRYLTRQQTEIVHLYYEEHMTQEEIASYLNKSRSAVKNSLALAKKKLMAHKEEIYKFFR